MPYNVHGIVGKRKEKFISKKEKEKTQAFL